MTIKEQLMEEMKAAMKAHEMDKLGVIRFLMSEIKNFEIDHPEATPADLQKVIASQVKKSKEAIEEYRAAGRDDLVASEQVKVDLMSAYLPAQLSDQELTDLIRPLLADSQLAANRGQLMGQIMKQVAGRADGARVQKMLQSLLAE